MCKSYNTIARNNNDTIVGITVHELFLDVLENSFRRGHNFKIVEFQKSVANNYVYLIAPTPFQAKKIQTLQISTNHLILEGQAKKGPSLTLEQKTKKEALILIFYNLPILMSIVDTTLEIRKFLGAKNVVSI